MSERLCTFAGCGRKHKGRGLCGGHLQQIRGGKELTALRERLPLVPRDMPLEERLWFRVEKLSPDECWEWKGSKSKGYGNLRFKMKTLSAHRVAWEVTNGPIPADMQIDHLCHNTACCNPNHLRLADASENNLNRQLPLGASGVRGASKARDRWSALASYKGKQRYLGTYDTPEEAAEVVATFYKEHGIITDSRSELLGLDPVKV